MKHILHTKFLILVALCIFFPASASAATVYMESSRASLPVGDTAVIAVKINADGGVLNTVDGEIAIKSLATSLAVQEFSLANSSFGLWPRTPSLSTDGKVISFVGGVPGGFSIEGATLFNIVVEAKKEGTITISPQNMSVYANDGAGTKLPVQMKNLVIQVTPKSNTAPARNDWAGIVAQDMEAPEPFIIVLGQDNSLFEGKKFAYFSSVDNQSGIDYYEVSENGGPAVRSGSTYVLQDQSDKVTLDVTAFDKAGNKTTATLTPESRPISWSSIIIIVLLGIIARMMYKKWKHKRNIVDDQPVI